MVKCNLTKEQARVRGGVGGGVVVSKWVIVGFLQSQRLQAVSNSVWSLRYQVQWLNVHPHTVCTVSIQLL